MNRSEEIYSYYASEEFLERVTMPRNTKWRHFRGRNAKGNWRKIPVQIHSKEDLQKWIVKLGLLDVYYSTSEWLQPHKVSTRKGPQEEGYVIADNLIIGADSLVFDIDADSPVNEKSLDAARKSTWNIYQQMLNYPGFEFEYASFTGMKGFRLSYKDRNISLPPNSLERYEFINNYRKVFIGRLLKDIEENTSTSGMYKVKAFFDEKITTNPMYVVRVLGTAHSKTNYLTVRITPESLKKPFKKLIKQIPQLGKEASGIPYWEMTPSDQFRVLGHKQPGKDVSEAASLPPPHFIGEGAYFFTNRVLGIKKGYIPVFIYQDVQKYYRKDLLMLQEKYKLGDIHVYKSGKSIVALSLKTTQRRQLQKILNESGSRTKQQFKKYKQLFIPLVMEKTEVLKGKYTGHLSRAHTKYVDNNKNRYVENRYVGWESLVMVRAEKNGN